MSVDFVNAVYFVQRPVLLSKSRDGLFETQDLSLKWELSNLIFAVAVSFFFIVQSTTIIDMFLNFARVAFVSKLDDTHFKVAERELLCKIGQRNW